MLVYLKFFSSYKLSLENPNVCLNEEFIHIAEKEKFECIMEIRRILFRKVIHNCETVEEDFT